MALPFLDTYDTNVWPDCYWVMAQNYRQLANGEYTAQSRWQWLEVEKLSNWFRHKSRRGVLCFATTARYQEKDKLSPQLCNLCGDFDAGTDADFPKIARSMDYLINHFMGLGLPDDYIRIWFSGGRSFHFEIAYQAFEIRPTVELNLRWKFVAQGLNELFTTNCFPLDMNMYSNPRMFRLPNSYYPKYDAFKIELMHDEIHLPISEIREMARQPQDPLYGEATFEDYLPIGKAADWYDEQVAAYQELEAERDDIPIDSEAIKKMVSVPVCIADLRTSGPKLPDTRNKCQMLDATYSLHAGESEAEAIAAIDSWTDVMPGEDRKKKERRASTRTAVKTIYANPDRYRFACGFAWHLELSCAKDACPLYKKRDLRKHDIRIRQVENVDWVPPSAKAVSTDDARYQLEKHFADWLIDWWGNPTKAIQAYTLPPGGGKTITPLKALERGIVTHTLYFGPTHKILDEQEVSFPQFYHVRARSFADESAAEQLCIMPQPCDAYARKRWNAVQHVCLAKCEKLFNCNYRWQFVPRDSVLTHEYLFSPTFTDWLTTGEGGIQPPHSWVTLIDEPSVSTFIETVNITNGMLTKAANQTRYKEVRKLLEVVRGAIEAACNSGEKPVRIVGEPAFDRIAEAATQVGVDLSELIANAQAAINEDKAPRIRVEFQGVTNISQSGKSIGFIINGQEVWLPANEIEFDEPARVAIIPQWLADKHGLEGMIDIATTEAEEGSTPELLLNFVEDLIRCLAADLEKENPFNSPLVILWWRGNPTLRLNRRRAFSHIKGPVVMLDACATPQLLSALTGRAVNSWSVPLKMASDDIIQTTDGYYGITSLWNKSGKPKSAVKRIMKAVAKIIQGRERQTLIVTWKALAQHLINLQETHKFDGLLKIAWYGGIEGLNAYEHLEQVILIGTPSAPAEDLVEMGQAIWADDPNPLNTEIIWKWRRYAYRDADGNGMEAKIWEFADGRLNMLLYTYREHEMIQAAHRIRPLLHKGRQIYLLSNLPIEELPPKRLTTLSELAGETQPEGYEEFIAVVTRVLDKWTGVWGNLMEGVCEEKSRIITTVINNIYYNNGDNARKLKKLSRMTITRWLSKAASELGLVQTTVSMSQNVRLKIWHRDGQLDIAKIHNLWEKLKGDNNE